MNKIFAIIIIGLLLTGCSIGEKKLKIHYFGRAQGQKLDIDMLTPIGNGKNTLDNNSSPKTQKKYLLN